MFEAIHRGDADPKLLAYQYLQVLPQIAQGDANKVWIIPGEFTAALDQIRQALPATAEGPSEPPRPPAGPPAPQR